jgi:hypothetical protein
MSDTISKAELAQMFRDMADRIDGIEKPKKGRKAKGSVPDTPAPLPLASVGIAPDEMTFRRHRGWVNHFCKLEGKEWIGEGPNPLDPHCKIDKRILQEFAGTLEQVREKIADERAMRERERA